MHNSFKNHFNVFQILLVSFFTFPAQASVNTANYKIDSSIQKPTQINIKIAYLYSVMKESFDYLAQRRFQNWPSYEAHHAQLALVTALNRDARIHGTYNVVPLDANDIGEHTANHWYYPGYPAFYYEDGPQRDKLKLTVSIGRVYGADGKLFDTSGASYIPLKADAFVTGEVAFVMDRFGVFYALPDLSQATLGHTSILGGLPVAAAGYLKVKNGEILAITNKIAHFTSHYPMPDEIFSQAIVELEKNGVKNADAIAKTIITDRTYRNWSKCTAFLAKNAKSPR